MPGRAFPSKPLQYGSYRWFQSQLGRMNPEVGADPDSFAKGDRLFIHDIINRGARRVYVPDNLQDGALYKWPFLTTRFEIQTKSGVSEYLLPEDCASVEGDLALDQADSGYTTVKKTTVQKILDRRSDNTSTSSYPQLFAETWSNRAGNTKQSRVLMLWPNPEGAFTLNGLMDVNPPDLDDEHPFPYGGDPMVEVLLASMLALISPDGEKLFQQRLRAAMQHHMLHNHPEFLGKNTNTANDWSGTRGSDGRYINFDPVTYS